MQWTPRIISAAVGLAVSASIAGAQTTVNYTTTGSFNGACSGLACTLGGMTISFNPLTSNSVTLDVNNGYFSFLSFGEFNVTGTQVGQQSFAGVSFALLVTQTLPTPGGTQILSGGFTGGIDKNSSNLRWAPLPTSWSIPYQSTNGINYTIGNPVRLQAPSSNLGVTSIQGDISTSIIPEPSTYVLMATGLAGLLVAARRRRAS